MPVTSPALAQDQPAITVDAGIPYVADAAPSQTLDVYRPAGTAAGRVALVLVHGGGFAGGSPDDVSRQARLAAQQGWVAFNVDYRTTSWLGTTGEAWPAERDDVRASVQWVRENATAYGADPQKIVLLGFSAGGTLAALVAADSSSRVRALATWSAPTDLTTLVASGDGVPACGENVQCADFWRNPWVTNFLGCTPAECPDRFQAASPLVQAPSMPPSFVANARNEIVPLDQAEMFANALHANRIDATLHVVPGSRHAHGYTDTVWNETIPFLASAVGVPAPEPIDFGDWPLDRAWATLAIVFAVVLVAAAIVVRVVTDRRRSRAW